MVLNTDESAGSTLVYNAEPLYFGATPESGEALSLEQETEAVIFNTLKDSVNDSSFSFSEDGKLVINFGDMIVQDAIDAIDTGNPVYDNAYKTFLNSANYSVSVVGDTVELNSTIKVTATRP